MKYQRIMIEVPALPDEAAAYLHKFVEAMMYAIDEQYYKQIHRYYSNQLEGMTKHDSLAQKDLDIPPF